MIEILPIKQIRDEDGLIFGSLNTKLSKLHHFDIPLLNGIVVTAPNLHLQTALEHYDFGSKEIFEQSLILVKKELESIPVPENLVKETKNKSILLCEGDVFKSANKLWIYLINLWLNQIKIRLWKDGFYKGIADDLDPINVYFPLVLDAGGEAYFDSHTKQVVINVKTGITHPRDLEKIEEYVQLANKKLIIHYLYEWMVDKGEVKFIKVLPYTPVIPLQSTIQSGFTRQGENNLNKDPNKSTIKVYMDFSVGLTVEKGLDGVYISSEKVFDLNKPHDSFEELTFKVVETGKSFPFTPVFLKLADKSEGMGKVRGALRLIHQQSLLDPMVEVFLFARKQKQLFNIHPVIPFVRSVSELLELRKKLATKNITRKASYQMWLELAVPENIINLEQYLLTGLDGVVINLDEMVAYLSGFDHQEQELSHYKRELSALTKFLEDGIKLLHKSKVPFIATGSLTLYPEILDFLVEKGVYGVVVDRYDALSAKDLLHQTERKIILRRS